MICFSGFSTRAVSVMPKSQTNQALEAGVINLVNQKIKSIDKDYTNNPKIGSAIKSCVDTNFKSLSKYTVTRTEYGKSTFETKNFSCEVTRSNRKSPNRLTFYFRLTSDVYKLLKLTNLGKKTYVEKCEAMYPKSNESATAEKKSEKAEKAEKAIKLIDRFIDHADGDLTFSQTDSQADKSLSVEDDELKLSISPDYDSQDQGDGTSVAVEQKDLVSIKKGNIIYKRFKRIMGAEGKNKNWIKDLEINKVPNKEIYSIKDKKSDLVFRLEVKKKGALLARPQETQTHSSVRWDKFARKLLKNANHKEALRRSLEDTKRINPIDASEGDGAASVSGAAVFAELGFKGSSFISPSKQQTPNHRTHELQGLGDVLGSSGEKGLETPKQGPNRNAGSLSPRQEEELIPSNAGSVKSGQGLGGDLEPLSDKQGMTNGFNFGQSNQNLDSSLTSIAGASDTGARYGLLYALGSLVGLGQSDEENSETDGSKSSTRGDRSWSDVGKSWGEFREDISGGRLSGTLTSAKTLIFGSNPLEGFDTQSSSNQ